MDLTYRHLLSGSPQNKGYAFSDRFFDAERDESFGLILAAG
jgi:hypothetical protein